MEPLVAGAGTNLNVAKRSRQVIEFAGKRVANPWKPAVTVENVQCIDFYFDDIEAELLEVLTVFGSGKVVVGCVAWLSNPRIIRALSHCAYVLLLVNDEDYSKWGNGRIPELYEQLPMGTQSPCSVFGHLDTPLNLLDCAGNYPPVWTLSSRGSNALMHSKYLVFFDTPVVDERGGGTGARIAPRAVWTGSFNFTKNASCNQENAQFIEDARVAKAYFQDFANSFIRAQPIRYGNAPLPSARVVSQVGF